MKEYVKKMSVLDVQNGASLRSTAHKYNMPLTTLAKLCRDAGVKSSFKKQEKRYSDQQIVNYIRRNGVAMTTEMAHRFGYTRSYMLKRLRKLVTKGVIVHVIKEKRYWQIKEKEGKT
jgi:predicted HTH transcriptional regulator